MKKKTFNVGETFYIGDGERCCIRLPRFLLDLLEEASSGRASPSQNELFRRVLWGVKWIRENKGEDVFTNLEAEYPDEVMNGTVEGELSDLGHEDIPLDSSVLEDVPFDEADMFWMVVDAPWIDFEDLPRGRLREKFPLMATHVRIVSILIDIVREDYSSTPERFARAMDLLMKIDSLKWLPWALKEL
ncbi:hypothetical protein [Salinibacter altiplanensis]|uniref:hypothetical protein n=1 Tax=Salinibacter altiplanensis TaxID=1803181 RepID=UPI000C9F9B66|nr:hypothetical protein [Salinibacter altiplanensis]